MNYKPHKLATMFPRADAMDTERMKNDIARNGCRVPIVLYEGKILDGLTRYEICKKVRRKPLFRPFYGTHEEAAAYVASLNLCRRHLTSAQKSAVAVSLKDLLEANGMSEVEAREEAAREARVSPDSVRKMERVKAADKKVAKEVLNGKKSIAEAVREIDPPTDAKIAKRLIRRAKAVLLQAKEYLEDAPKEVTESVGFAVLHSKEALESQWFYEE
jgi:hypothetical protein